MGTGAFCPFACLSSGDMADDNNPIPTPLNPYYAVNNAPTTGTNMSYGNASYVYAGADYNGQAVNVYVIANRAYTTTNTYNGAVSTTNNWVIQDSIYNTGALYTGYNHVTGNFTVPGNYAYTVTVPGNQYVSGYNTVPGNANYNTVNLVTNVAYNTANAISVQLALGGTTRTLTANKTAGPTVYTA